MNKLVHKIVLAASCLLLSLCGPTLLLAQAPSISSISPGALMPGETVDVTITGANLAGVSELWTSFYGHTYLTPGVEKNGTNASTATYRIVVPKDAQIGIAAIRVATGKGVSSLRLLMIDDLKSVADSGKNNSLAQAQSVTLPIAVDGSCQSVKSDYYKFSAKAGQRISVEAVAQRIGSPLDPEIRLLDASGRTLSGSDDQPGLGADGRFAYVIPTDGSYAVQIFDVKNGGSAAHRYRLRIGNFPLLNVAYPLGGKAGTTQDFSFVGALTKDIVPVHYLLPKDAPTGFATLGAKFTTGQGSGFVVVAVGQQTDSLEAEPNNKPTEANKITLPGAISGRFERAKDVDYFQFEAKKGQRFVFLGTPRRMGSPSDLFMRLFDSKGAKLAEAEDTGTNEGSMNYTFPADGTYHLMVEDLLRRGGLSHAYRIEVVTYRPGFRLSVENEKYDAPQNGTFVAKVTCIRQGYTGPITLRIQAIGEAGKPINTLSGLKLANQVIAKGKKETRLSVTFPPEILAGRMFAIRIIGTAKIGEEEVSAIADTRAAMTKIMPNMEHPPVVLDGQIGLGIGPVFPPFYEINLDKPAQFAQLIGKSSFKVKLKRLQKDFKTPITLAVQNLPAGFSAKVKPVGKGEAEYIVSLSGPTDIGETIHSFQLVATGSYKNQTKQVVLSKLPLTVVKPLAVTVSFTGPITQGEKQKVTITINRFGGPPAAVSVRFQSGPSGLLTPIETIIAADKSEATIELAAASDAQTGKFNNVVAIATATIKGQPITVVSPTATIEIKTIIIKASKPKPTKAKK